MQPIFFNIVGVSVTISIVVILLMLSSSFINGRYTVKWRYFIWLFLAVRLILPVDFGLTSPPIELILQDREIVYSADQKRLSDPAPSEQGGLAANGSAAPEQESAYERTLESYDTEASADGKDAGKTISVSQIATGLYFLGMAIFFIWQFGLYFAFRQSTRRWYRMVSNPLVLETFEKLKLEMGIIKPFRLRICKKILSPMIIGLFRPTLLLPHEGYQKIDLEVIIRHELVHFKRNDLWFKLLLVCANAVHWFNPVIYLMVREANRDIEISCDEESLKNADLSLKKRYSERILELMRGNKHQEAPVSTNFLGGKNMMKSRIRHIFDERAKKKGVLSCGIIMTLILLFSACQFDMSQNQWQIPIMKDTADAYGKDETGERSAKMHDFAVSLPFDKNRDDKNDASFSLLVSDEGATCELKYEADREESAKTQVLKGVEPGFAYGLQAANLEDTNTVMLMVSIDYYSMPFGGGYREFYTWEDGRFQEVDVKAVEENLMLRIMEPAEINAMDAATEVYLYDKERYPAGYPAIALYFRDESEKGENNALGTVYYAPLSEYDVEGYHTWGQETIYKTMTEMNFVSGADVEGWNEPSRALLETKEIVSMTFPNITATVKRYYQYRDGEWSSVDGYIEDGYIE